MITQKLLGNIANYYKLFGVAYDNQNYQVARG